MSSEEIRTFQTLGPGTVLDLAPGLCGRYLVVPRFFSNIFPHLNESSGLVRLTRENDINSFFRSDEATDAISDVDSQVKEKEKEKETFSEGFSTENLQKLDLPAAEQTTINNDHCNKDVEMSLLGAIFMTVVGGIFIVNVITGSS
jgi:hypothetical protein